MIVQCTNCATKFNFPDDKFNEGLKVRCSICKHVFALSQDVLPEQTVAAPVSAPDVSPDVSSDVPPSSPAEFDVGGDFDSALNTAQESSKDPGAGININIDIGDVPEVDLGGEEPSKAVSEEFDLGDGELSFDLDAPSKKKKGKKEKKGKKSLPKLSAPDKKTTKLALVAAIIVLLVTGGLFVLLPADYNPFKESQALEDDVVNPEQIKDITIADVSNFFVDNEKIGQLLVIQGRVINNFPVPKELIKIHAKLYDQKGSTLMEKKLLCGNEVSLFQLETLGKKELEMALNNKVGILASNTNVKPDEDVPFVVVFYNPPDTMHELGVDVFSAKNPPEK